jgi:multiple sugar transport system substrate-binding protein
MTSNIRRRTAMVGAATTAALALAACSSGGGEDAPSGAEGDGTISGEISIGYAAGGAWGDYIEAQIDRIEAEYPDLTIESVVYPTYDDQLNQLPTEFAGGTAPDIIQWDGAAPIAQYATEGVLAPLDDAVAESGKDLSVYPESLITGWTIEDQLVGLPLFLQNSAMAFNTQVLADAGITEVPKTLDEVAAAAAAVSDKGSAEGVVLLDTLFHISQYLYAFGGGYDYGRTINSEENVEGLTYLVDLFADGHASTAQQLSATWDGEAFAQKKAAISDAGPWYVSFMDITAPDSEYALTPLPSKDGEEQTVVSYSGGFSINEQTENLDAAWAVLEMFTDEEAQAALLESGTQVPAMTEYVGQYRDATPVYAAFTDEVIANGRTLDYPLQSTEFGNALVTGFQDLVFKPGSSTPKELLDELQETYGQ